MNTKDLIFKSQQWGQPFYCHFVAITDCETTSKNHLDKLQRAFHERFTTLLQCGQRNNIEKSLCNTYKLNSRPKTTL